MSARRKIFVIVAWVSVLLVIVLTNQAIGVY